MDADLFWSLDVNHFPNSVSPLDFSLILKVIFEYSGNTGFETYDIPLKCRCLHMNTYLYYTIIYECSEEADIRMKKSIKYLESLEPELTQQWEKECLPEIKKHIAFWETFDLNKRSIIEILEKTESIVKRLWEIHELLHLPLHLPLHLLLSNYEDMYRDLMNNESHTDPFEFLGAGWI